MNTSRFVFTLLVLLAPRAAFAQTVFAESEPNNTRATATVVVGMTSGDTLTGVSVPTPGQELDWFEVTTAPLPPGIYRHQLVLTSGPASGHSSALMGREQTGTPGSGGVPLNTDIGLQGSFVPWTSQVAPTGPYAQWYGFGKQERIYYRVTGTTAATDPYTVTLTTTPVAPSLIPPVFESSAPITITTRAVYPGPPPNVETEILLYDATFTPVPGALNDDDAPWLSNGGNSTLTRTYAPGTYYLVVSGGNTANDQLSPPDEGWPRRPLSWFPDCLIQQYWKGIWHFKITGSNGSYTQFNYAAPSLFGEVSWWKLTLAAGVPAPPPPLSICEGVGCPCANDGAAGRGCGNSLVASGALLDTSGNPSLSADSLDLLAHDTGGPCLFFQAGSSQAGGPYGDGLLCVSGFDVKRLAVSFPAGGVAAYSTSGAAPVHLAGAPIAAGEMKFYQGWYRDSVPFCTSSTFNVTNGVLVTWTP